MKITTVKDIKHRSFPKDIINSKGKNILDIGCGRNKIPESVGLDHIQLPGVDIVANLNEPLPLEDESFDIVHADQVLEHISNLIGLIYEIHRILKPGGILIAHVPYFRSSWAHIDPTHVRSFTIQSMNFYVKGNHQYDVYRFDERAFSNLDIFIEGRFPSTPLRSLTSSLALRNPGGFENSWLSNAFPFSEISYILTK
jgi:SAM-dependent methyltransferase